MNKLFLTIKYLGIILVISAVITYIINPNLSDTLSYVSRNSQK